MKKTVFFSLLLLFLVSCDPLEKITIKNDTEFVYKFQFPQQPVIVNPKEEYEFGVIGVYSKEEHKTALEGRLDKISIIERNRNGAIDRHIGEEVPSMINNGLEHRDGKWLILCSKLN